MFATVHSWDDQEGLGLALAFMDKKSFEHMMVGTTDLCPVGILQKREGKFPVFLVSRQARANVQTLGWVSSNPPLYVCFTASTSNTMWSDCINAAPFTATA